MTPEKVKAPMYMYETYMYSLTEMKGTNMPQVCR